MQKIAWEPQSQPHQMIDNSSGPSALPCLCTRLDGHSLRRDTCWTCMSYSTTYKRFAPRHSVSMLSSLSFYSSHYRNSFTLTPNSKVIDSNQAPFDSSQPEQSLPDNGRTPTAHDQLAPWSCHSKMAMALGPGPARQIRANVPAPTLSHISAQLSSTQ
ncbi:hypothetical protein B0F90DRAFT_1729835 [Multifurca ochricompacta]|uniref:Uncharacterized protein n=1 Tax=Multifurca ochricompacta TaxID=376703 RepID=A0AAD4M1S1_9AGAM|nr:hypothetical protein B0F90DRAFT_1729835 [Multifurca ochricompacta]